MNYLARGYIEDPPSRLMNSIYQLRLQTLTNRVNVVEQQMAALVGALSMRLEAVEERVAWAGVPMEPAASKADLKKRAITKAEALDEPLRSWVLDVLKG